MVKVILAIDTEDFITPEADEALKRLCETFTSLGIKACFCIVGERLRVLKKRNRKDIINLLAKHEVDYHSNYHSVHPTVAEYNNRLNWRDGIGETIKREYTGIKEIRDTFGEGPYANVPPGSSWSPQALFADKAMGIPIFAGLLGFNGGRLIDFCNILNIRYHLWIDPAPHNSLQYLKKRFNKLYKNTETNGYIVLYIHDAMFACTGFWGAFNFYKGANPKEEKWKSPPLRTPTGIEKAFNVLTEF